MIANPIRSLAGQTVVYGMGTILPRLLNYLMVPLYTRVFEQGIYGQITELYAYVAFLIVLLTYGMETAFFRYAQKNDPKVIFSNALSCILLTTGIFLLIVMVFYQDIADLILYSGNPEFILFIGLIVGLDAFTAVPFAMLRKLNLARRFAIIKVTNVILNIGLNLLFIVVFPEFSINLAKFIFGPESGLLVWVFISNIAASLLSLLMLWPVLKTFRIVFNRSIIRPMINYALPVLVVGVAGMVNEVIDKILLKFLLPDENTAMAQLGIYGANYKLGILMTLFIQMFRYASEPFFFAEAEKKNAPELFSRVMNYFVIFGLLIFLMVTLYINVFQLFIGEGYRGGLGIVPIILMANLFYGIFYNLSVWYKLTDRTRDGAYISIAGAMITIVINVLFIPSFGYYASAWGHFVCYLVMMVASYVWGQKVYPIPYMTRRLLLYFIIAIAIFFIARLTEDMETWMRMVMNTFMLLGFAGFAFMYEIRSKSKLTAQ
jgi:O-antigen/teichoic acid export membrane protein